jgi:hypothetical protein
MIDNSARQDHYMRAKSYIKYNLGIKFSLIVDSQSSQTSLIAIRPYRQLDVFMNMATVELNGITGISSTKIPTSLYSVINIVLQDSKNEGSGEKVFNKRSELDHLKHIFWYQMYLLISHGAVPSIGTCADPSCVRLMVSKTHLFQLLFCLNLFITKSERIQTYGWILNKWPIIECLHAYCCYGRPPASIDACSASCSPPERAMTPGWLAAAAAASVNCSGHAKTLSRLRIQPINFLKHLWNM